MKKRYWFILSLFCLAIYGLTQFSTQTSATQFNTALLQLDTTQITQLTIATTPTTENISLYRIPTGWQVSYGEVSTRALTEAVNDLLEELTMVQTARVATNHAEQWDDYGVGETALRLKITTLQEDTETLLLGERQLQTAQQPDTTFARFPNEDEVYALVDFNYKIFAQSFAHYRQRGLVQITANQVVKQLELAGKDTVQQLAGTWKTQRGVFVDSSYIADYLECLKYVEAAHFADNFDETQTTFLPQQKLIIRGDNITPAIQIVAYYDSTATLPFTLHSSQFPNSFYASDSSGVYEQLFGIFTFGEQKRKD